VKRLISLGFDRVITSIKEVSNAIVDYVNESKPLDDGMNGASPRRGLVWLESSFVGTKPIDSEVAPSVVIPTTPRTGTTSPSRPDLVYGQNAKKTLFRPSDAEERERSSDSPQTSGRESTSPVAIVTKSPGPPNSTPPAPPTNAPTTTPYSSRNGEYLLA